MVSSRPSLMGETLSETLQGNHARMIRILVILFLGITLRIHEAENASSNMRIPSFAGPVKVVGKQLSACPAEMRGKDLLRLTSAIIKETREKPLPRVFTTLELRRPFDDTLQLSASLASWSRVSGWTPNAVKFVFRKACSDLKAYYHDLVDRLEKYIEGDHKFCPHQVAKNVTINGAPAYFVPNRKLIVAFPYGRWRADIFAIRNTTTEGCFRLVAETVPLVN